MFYDKEIINKIKNNQCLTIGELKKIRDYLNLECDIIPFNDINYNNKLPKIILLQKDLNNELLPLGHFICYFIKDNILYYFDSSDGSKPLELQKTYNISTKLQPLDNFYNFLKKYKLDYFDMKLQEKNSSNCGIQCILRLINMDLTNDEYKEYLKYIKQKYNFKTYDNLINNLILLYLEN